MGEYARFRGSDIKIGTCESMYYLRADQRHLIDGYTFDTETLGVLRFRFPFPDEDHLEPGSFEDYDRGVRIPGGMVALEPIAGELDHGSIQFKHEAGYLCSLPCPEGPTQIEGVTIHRNGWNGGPRITMQGYREGELRVIVACGSCGSCWNMPREIAAAIAESFLEEAIREEWRRKYDPETDTYLDDFAFESVHGLKYREELQAIAARILAGYDVAVPA